MQGKYYNETYRFKTEKALQIINHYQGQHSQLFTALRNRQKSVPRFGKNIQEGKWVRVQLLPNTFDVYVLGTPSGKQIKLKIIIKEMTGGGVRMALSSRNEIPSPQNCQYSIKKERIIKIFNYSLTSHGKNLIIHSMKDLTFFKIKYQFQANQSQQINSQSLNKEISNYQLNRFSPQLKNKSNSLKKIIFSSKNESSFLQKINSQRDLKQTELKQKLGNMQYQKNKIQLKRGLQLRIKREQLLSARQKSLQQQRQKEKKVKDKKKKIQILRQKSKSLRVISGKCRNMLTDYEQVQQTIKNQVNALKTLVRLISVAKFMSLCSENHKNTILHIEKAAKIKIIMKKFIQKLKLKQKQTVQIIPKQIFRELVGLQHYTVVNAKMVYKTSLKNAHKIMISCLTQLQLVVHLNGALQLASQYRRKIRTIQNFWTTRNKAQLLMLKTVVDDESLELMEKHKQFKTLRQQFLTRNMYANISWQYLIDSSRKIKSLVAAYNYKLNQIQEIKVANKQIQEFNAKALKKNQKNLLMVPIRPSPPLPRYFRDLNILKSMIRTWFQTQVRKRSRKSITKIKAKSKH